MTRIARATLFVRWMAVPLVALLGGASLASLAGEPSPDLMPLKLQLPRPQFIGSPIHLKGPNLAKCRPGTCPDPLPLVQFREVISTTVARTARNTVRG